MSDTRRLGFVIRLVGVAFIVFFTIALVWSIARASSSGLLYDMFGWGSVGDAEEQMISAVYIIWGVFLLIAATDPVRHSLFVDFTIWGNGAHFGTMLIQAIVMHGEHTHLVGDVLVGWSLVIVLAAYWYPIRRSIRAG